MSAGTPTAATAATIFVNDLPRPLPEPATVAGLLRALGLAERKGVAVALNGGVVSRAAWPTHPLAERDRVLIIRATQGG